MRCSFRGRVVPLRDFQTSKSWRVWNLEHLSGTNQTANPQLDAGPGHSRQFLKCSPGVVPGAIGRGADLFEERSRDSVRLVEKCDERMLIGGFLLVELRGDIVGSLQDLLHCLSEFVDANRYPGERRYLGTQPSFSCNWG